MQLVFNELSLASSSYFNSYECENIIEKFIKTYSSAIKKDIGFAREITTTIDLNSINISLNYNIAKWRNSTSTDKDLVRRYKGMCDRQQVSNFFDDDIDLKCERGIGRGLLAAYENNATAISFTYDNYWKNYELTCEYYSLSNNMSNIVIIHNLSDEKQLEENFAKIQEKRNNEVLLCKTPQQLLEKLEILFPSLIFHENSINQIKSQVDAQHVPTICRKLFELEKYFCNWDGSLFDESAFPTRSVSPQSKETLKRFKKEHTFSFVEREVLVSYHIRYTGNIPGRIYFHPDSESKKALICSLTTKMPTVSSPTSRA
jgi:hypothetical protein